MPDIMLLQELPKNVSLDPIISNFFSLLTPSFNGDRHQVGILIDKSLLSSATVINMNSNNILGVAFEKFDVITIYNPIQDVNNQTMHVLKGFLESRKLRRVLLVGDFNAHCDLWNSTYNKRKNKQDLFVQDFIVDLEFDILNVNKTTFLSHKKTGSVIDLVLARHLPVIKTNIISSLDVGHFPIEIDIYNDQLKSFPHSFRNWKKADWKSINLFVKKEYDEKMKELMFGNFATVDYINAQAQIITSVFKDSIDKFVPSMHVKSFIKFNKHLIGLQVEGKKARRKANKIRKALSMETNALKINELTSLLNYQVSIYKKYKEHLKREKNKYEEYQAMHLNHSNLFKKIRDLKCRGKSTTTLLGPCTAEEAVDKLAQSFFHAIPQEINVKDNIPLGLKHYAISVEEYSKALKRLNDRSAPGLDGIPVKFIKNTKAVESILIDFYNKILKFGIHPVTWKTHLVQAVFKKNRTSIVSEKDYRPITLISTLSKLLEGIITERIMTIYVKSDNHLHHHGGIKGRSTESALRNIINSASEFKFLKPQRDIFISKCDVEDAYPSTLIIKVIEELKKLKVDRHTTNWILDFHQHRYAHIKVNEKVYNKKYQIIAGLQQGSPLSSILWAIYGNSFPVIFLAKDSKKFSSDPRLPAVSCYVDDYATVLPLVRSQDLTSSKKKIVDALKDTFEVCEKMEETLLLSSKFNHKKSAFISKSKNAHSVQIKVRNQDTQNLDIPIIESFKLLGITLDYKLSFKLHIDKILLNTKLAILQSYKFARKLPFYKSRYVWYCAILPLAIYNISNWLTIENFDYFVDRLQLLQNMWLRKVTRIELNERPNIKNVAVELNYMPCHDKVFQLLHKAEKRALRDIRVKSFSYNEKDCNSKVLSLHSSTKFRFIREKKSKREIPHTKKNLIKQWYFEWKTENLSRNKLIIDDLSPSQRLALYSKLSLLEARSILRARSENLLSNVTRCNRGFDTVPLCACLLEKDSILHLLAVCPILDNYIRLKIKEEMLKQKMIHPLSCPDCYPLIHSLLRSDPRLFPREPD
jgi:hypothetical protein